MQSFHFIQSNEIDCREIYSVVYMPCILESNMYININEKLNSMRLNASTRGSKLWADRISVHLPLQECQALERRRRQDESRARHVKSVDEAILKASMAQNLGAFRAEELR